MKENTTDVSQPRLRDGTHLHSYSTDKDLTVEMKDGK